MKDYNNILIIIFLNWNKLNKIIKNYSKTKRKNKPNKLQNDSLSKQFKTQLDELLIMISRYIKCINPNNDLNQKFKIQMMRWIFCIENKVSIFEEQKKSFIILIILTKNVKLNIFTEDVKNMLKILCDLEEMKNVMKGKKIIQVSVLMKEEIKTILDQRLMLKFEGKLKQRKIKNLIKYCDYIKKNLEEKIEEKTRKKMLMNFKIKLNISKEKKIIKN